MTRIENHFLEKTLHTLIKGSQDVVLYGPKSCGKTYLAKSILNKSMGGPDKYILIKGMLVSSKTCFFTLFNEGFINLIKDIGGNFISS